MDNEGKEEIAKEFELVLKEIELSKTTDERQKAIEKVLKIAKSYGEMCSTSYKRETR
jgi:hypothetical protein